MILLKALKQTPLFQVFKIGGTDVSTIVQAPFALSQTINHHISNKYMSHNFTVNHY